MCLSFLACVHDVWLPVPLLLSTANAPPSVWASAGLTSKPLPSPPEAAAFAVGLRRPVFVGGGGAESVPPSTTSAYGCGPLGTLKPLTRMVYVPAVAD